MILTITGPSGVGKTTITNLLGLNKVKTATTREKREVETNDDYYFLTEMEFDRLSSEGKLLCETQIYGHKYGIPKEELKDNSVIILDEKGVEELKSKNKNIKSILLLTGKDTQLKNLEKRNEQNICERMNNEKYNLNLYDNIVFNKNLDKTVEDIKTILKGG